VFVCLFVCLCVCVCLFILDIKCYSNSCQEKPVRGCQHGAFCERHLAVHRKWMRSRNIKESESDVLSEVLTLMSEKAKSVRKGLVWFCLFYLLSDLIFICLVSLIDFFFVISLLRLFY
jgi:hypothetical protein